MQEAGERIKAASLLLEENAREHKEFERQFAEQRTETQRWLAEQHAETERWLAEQRTETERRLAEQRTEIERYRAETERRRAETERQLNKSFGELTNRFGEMLEYTVMPNLVTKFRELNFEVTRAYRVKIADKEHYVFTEVDAFLENGDKVIIVEIKTKPDIDDVNDHIERMDKLRKLADSRNDHRIYLGAIAGTIMNDNVREYALLQGFYAIVPSGDTFNIMVPEGSRLREW